MATKQTKVKRPTPKEKVAVYEALLYEIDLHTTVTMNDEAIREIIRRINRWSYAHRSGNGEKSEAQQQQEIDSCFWKLDIRNKYGNEK